MSHTMTSKGFVARLIHDIFKKIWVAHLSWPIWPVWPIAQLTHELHDPWPITIIGAGALMPYFYSSSCCGRRSSKKPKAPSFQIGSGWNLVHATDCSWSKYASIDGVGFLMWRLAFKMAPFHAISPNLTSLISPNPHSNMPGILNPYHEANNYCLSSQVK